MDQTAPEVSRIIGLLLFNIFFVLVQLLTIMKKILNCNIENISLTANYLFNIYIYVPR